MHWHLAKPALLTAVAVMVAAGAVVIPRSPRSGASKEEPK
jgi:hypothetical protein